MANFDAGGGQKKDKLPIILQVVEAAAKLCEVGYEVEMYFISAWPASQEESRKQIEEKLLCERIGKQVPLTFWDHFNKTVVGNLASRHRLLVEEKLEDFDFFIHVEDDVDLLVEQVEAFREEADFLSTTHRANRFYPGFVRYELVNASSSSSSSSPAAATSTSTETDTDTHTPAPIRGVWEGTSSDCQVEEVEGRWYVKTGGFSNQAGWMASREQVQRFNNTCNEPFFSPWEDGWVEYWSSIQIYEQCKLRKVFPLEQFDLFSMYHLSNNKVRVCVCVCVYVCVCCCFGGGGENTRAMTKKK
jgi:hypothetical protein